MLIFVRRKCVFVSFMCCVSLLSERGGASVDHFDIVERVEMGQMASMFFNKGEVSMPTLTAVRLKRNSLIFL